jgi:1-aminocyclopropane-1-carboxylate deaminase/D-cysteine desulfhydrase-like pyridoxal-dependent ACC family enzyme
MPVGGHSVTGALGYVAGALELTEQLRAHGVSRATVVAPAGTGGTLAGLMAGRHLLSAEFGVLGIDVGKLWRGFPASIAGLASELCAHLGQAHTFEPADVPLIEGRYVGPRYAIETTESRAAVEYVAREEGLVLDPVYTAKAMAGLLDLARSQRWRQDEDVVFLHTGGLPALWAY